MPSIVRALFALFALLQVADLALTLAGVAHGIHEANAVVAVLLASPVAWLFPLAKLAAIPLWAWALIAIGPARRPEYGLTRAVCYGGLFAMDAAWLMLFGWNLRALYLHG